MAERHIEVTVRGEAVPSDAMVLAVELWLRVGRIDEGRVRFSTRTPLELDDVLGGEVTVSIVDDGEPALQRTMLVVEAELEPAPLPTPGDPSGPLFHYVLELAHELVRATLRADVRMFQDQSVPDVLKAVLEGAGLASARVSMRLSGSYAKRVCTVQHRETDFAFISRLCEDEGIAFHVEQDADSPTLVLVDDTTSSEPIAGSSTIAVSGGHGHGFSSLRFEGHVVPATVTLSDTSYELPSIDLTAPYDLGPGARGDAFEFPAGHTTPDEGAKKAELRGQALRAASWTGQGASDVPTLAPGRTFTLEGTTREALATDYLVLEVHHEWRRGERAAYRNDARFLPKSTPYRMPVVTPRPRLRGLHSAVVTGPSGAEIHTEQHGRAKAYFHWDRVGSRDDSSSPWMRQAQLPLDGSLALARVGWEMGVAYHEGLLERPIMVARLYNAEKVSPYGYPGAKTRMSLQTASSPGGGKTNELRMEDGGGGQEWMMNASKDLVHQTNRHKTETIGVSSTIDVGTQWEISVGADETISIGGDQTATVSTEDQEAITGDRTVSVSGSETVTVMKSVETVVKGSVSETVGGSHTTLAAMQIDRSASAGQTISVGGTMVSVAAGECSFMAAGALSDTIGGAKLVVSGKGIGETVGGALANNVGGVMLQAAGGNRIGSTSGATAITVGGVMAAAAGDKVVLKGKKVKILVGGVATFLGGGGNLTLTPASASLLGLITLDASGSIQIKGNPNLVG